jgi:hypothetical protein
MPVCASRAPKFRELKQLDPGARDEDCQPEKADRPIPHTDVTAEHDEDA